MKDDKTAGLAFDLFSRTIVNFGERQLGFFTIMPNKNKLTLLITPSKIKAYLNDEFVMEEENRIKVDPNEVNHIGIRTCHSGKVNIARMRIFKSYPKKNLEEVSQLINSIARK